MRSKTIGGHKPIPLCIAAILGVHFFLGAPFGGDVFAEDNLQETVRLTVKVFDGHDDNPKLVMVTLLSGGKAIRSRQLDRGWFTSEKTEKSITWDKLPVGSYELQFQADGYEKSVYQIGLSKDDKELKVGVPIMKKVGIGNDAAFQHLADRVKKLEADNAELRAAAVRLQREIEQLKKK